MENKLAYVIIKEHFTNESVHDIQCVCLTRDEANKECERIQEEIDPDYNEWKIVYEAVDMV